MEAHNGISAKIVEEAGFEGIWASGLSMSAALGVRDSNEASWTQVLEMLEFMADATGIPILVDGDTGYGNFNNVRRLVKKLCQRGIAGVCIEDKLFPKTNSFIGENQPLADVGEFCGRIKAGKDNQSDDDFQIVARVEGADRGLGHGGGAAPGRGLSGRRRRRRADPLEEGDRRRDHRLLRGLGRPRAGGDRADHVPPDADPDLPRRRRLHGDLGQSQHARRGLGDAPGQPDHQRRANGSTPSRTRSCRCGR